MIPERTGLTRATRRCFNAIEAYIAVHDCSPSFEDIRTALGVASKGVVHRLVNDLVARGWITYQPHKKRSIVIVPAAKVPSLALPSELEAALKAYCARRGLLPGSVLTEAVAARIGLAELGRTR